MGETLEDSNNYVACLVICFGNGCCGILDDQSLLLKFFAGIPEQFPEVYNFILFHCYSFRFQLLLHRRGRIKMMFAG